MKTNFTGIRLKHETPSAPNPQPERGSVTRCNVACHQGHDKTDARLITHTLRLTEPRSSRS